ncbi:MAG: Hsp20/alpha crystallin family protein [Acidobacteriota bacterium]
MYRTTTLFDELSQVFQGLDEALSAADPTANRLRLWPAPTRALARLSSGTGRFCPPVEVARRDKDLVFRAELPGVKPEELDVQVIDGHLVLRGEKKAAAEEQDANVFYREVTHGTFERSFILPEGVTAESVQARFDNGVLTVTIPEATALEGTRRVPIQIEGGKTAATTEVKKSA